MGWDGLYNAAHHQNASLIEMLNGWTRSTPFSIHTIHHFVSIPNFELGTHHMPLVVPNDH